jgi:hypothetical protein
MQAEAIQLDEPVAEALSIRSCGSACGSSLQENRKNIMPGMIKKILFMFEN